MQTKLAKYTITYPNQEEYHYLKNEIFTHDCYYFETENAHPLILDVGAYIGISVLYFKREYPDCKIIAFEPNPDAVAMLEENIFNNALDNIEVHQTAIWDENGEKNLYIDKTGLDRFSVASFSPKAWDSSVESNKIIIKTERLDKYLNQEVDLLKLDIEGSEQKVLKSIKKLLPKIKNIILEYHPTNNQDINKVLDILKPNFDISVFLDGKEINKNIPKDKLLTIKAICKN